MRKKISLSTFNKAKDAGDEYKHMMLIDAFNRVMTKPNYCKIGKNKLQIKQHHWNDFCFFMQTMYPKVHALCNVTTRHAEDYMNHLIHHGKYTETAKLAQDNKKIHDEIKISTLSTQTINDYLSNIKEVFNSLKDDANLSRNPFDSIRKLELKREEHKAFTSDELELIFNNSQKNDLINGIFMVGLYTGLKEADICMLRWVEVDIDNAIIQLRSRTDNKEIVIPVMPPLKKYLIQQQEKKINSEYVLPESADIYYIAPI